MRLAHKVRLVTITATRDISGGLRLISHWDLGAVPLNVETTVASGHIPTIWDLLLPAADRVEREIRHYYDTRLEPVGLSLPQRGALRTGCPQAPEPQCGRRAVRR